MTCDRLLSPIKNENCEVNVTKVLEMLSKSPKNYFESELKSTSVKKSHISGHFFFSLKDMLVEEMKYIEQNRLHYVCGYLVKNIQKWHNCNVCNRVLCCKSYSKEYETFTKLTQYKTKNDLINVSPEFHFYVEKLEKKLISIFDTKCYIENISKEIIKELI